MEQTLLQLKNISVTYGGVVALDDVSITLDRGEIVALMGPNGAGKSTVIKTIFGLSPIKQGSVIWCGKKIKPIPYKVAHYGIS